MSQLHLLWDLCKGLSPVKPLCSTVSMGQVRGLLSWWNKHVHTQTCPPGAGGRAGDPCPLSIFCWLPKTCLAMTMCMESYLEEWEACKDPVEVGQDGLVLSALGMLQRAALASLQAVWGVRQRGWERWGTAASVRSCCAIKVRALTCRESRAWAWRAWADGSNRNSSLLFL